MELLLLELIFLQGKKETQRQSTSCEAPDETDFLKRKREGGAASLCVSLWVCDVVHCYVCDVVHIHLQTFLCVCACLSIIMVQYHHCEDILTLWGHFGCMVLTNSMGWGLMLGFRVRIRVRVRVGVRVWVWVWVWVRIRFRLGFWIELWWLRLG